MNSYSLFLVILVFIFHQANADFFDFFNKKNVPSNSNLSAMEIKGKKTVTRSPSQHNNFLSVDDLPPSSESPASSYSSDAEGGITWQSSWNGGLPHSPRSVGRISGTAYSNAVADTLQPEQVSSSIHRLLDHFPKINFRMEPNINFLLRQKIRMLGANIELGMEYVGNSKCWRTLCTVEDAMLHGRFSLRGNEVSWTKSWIKGLGDDDDLKAKFKVRLVMNLQTLQTSMRLRLRSSYKPFDLGDGIMCGGSVPLPVTMSIFHSLPMRIDYRIRATSIPTSKSNKRKQTHGVFLKTGIDEVQVSLEQLNFCLDWNEDSLYRFGISSARRMLPPSFRNNGNGNGNTKPKKQQIESRRKNEENESSSSSINVPEKEKVKERTPIAAPPPRYPSYRAYPPEFHYSPVHNVFI